MMRASKNNLFILLGFNNCDNDLCKRDAVEDAASKGDFVGIFEVVAYGDAPGNGGYFDVEGDELFVDVEAGGVSFHCGGECKDYLFDRGGMALTDAL